MTEVQTPEQGTENLEEQPIQIAPETPVTPTEAPEEVPQEQPDGIEQPSAEPEIPEGYIPKEKFVASAQESILNAERVKVKEAQIENLTKTDTPTDEVMRLVYPEWDEFNEVTKKAFIKQEVQEIKQRRIELQQQDIIDRQRLEDELEAVIESNPKLQNKESEFKRFARNPKNKGINADVLAKAFLFDASEEQPAKPAAKPEALPQGSGGDRQPLKPKKISIEEAAKIRQTDNNRYMELAKAGLIDDEL
jgi:hypothetical protein